MYYKELDAYFEKLFLSEYDVLIFPGECSSYGFLVLVNVFALNLLQEIILFVPFCGNSDLL